MTDPLDDLARELYLARAEDRAVPLGSPPSLSDARAVLRRLGELEDSPTVGFKIGATTAATLGTLGLERPFFGALHARHHHPDGASVRLPRARPASVEVEAVVEIASDLVLGPDGAGPEGQGADRVARVAEAAGAVRAGLELVGTRFDVAMPGNGTALVADAACNVATVLGGGPGHAGDPGAIPAEVATLEIDGARVASGSGRDSLGGHPFAMVAWLLGRAAFARRGLCAGELVFCGTHTGAVPVAPGQRVSADFGSLGKVSVVLE